MTFAFSVIVFRLVRDVVANHKTTRYAGAATKSYTKKFTLLKYNVGVQAALYAKKGDFIWQQRHRALRTQNGYANTT